MIQSRPRPVKTVERDILSALHNASAAAALTCVHALGRGRRKWADQLAVEAMRESLNRELPIPARVVIGEGERDEAPMLFIGEELGEVIIPDQPFVRLAVDPLEGTNLCALGKPGAICIVAGALDGEGYLLEGIDGYMQKIVLGNKLRCALGDWKTKETFPSLHDGKGLLDFPIELILSWIAEVKRVSIHNVVVEVLDRPRNQGFIEKMRRLNVQIKLISDGDITAGLEALDEANRVDLAYGIGAAPEGVITAAAARVFDGYMETQWWFEDNAKGEAQREQLVRKRIDPDKRMYLHDLASGEVMFAFTAVTDNAFMRGIKQLPNGGAESQGMFGRTRSGTIHRPKTIHARPPALPEFPTDEE